ncbi:MAG TPA: molybdenum cofactor guanylyltransferase [Polyangia bacterium]|nr:molybdenum cofactor guanylyltransferase [Polyangia bacterium]
MTAPVAAAIIAGGAATRLGGVPKSTLVVEGRSIAERLLETLRATFARVLVVANDPTPWQALGVEIVPDVYPDAGPLAGVHAALVAASAHAGVVCVAGDMPFVVPALLALLRDHAPEAAALVPRVGGRPEPLLARWGSACLPVVAARLAARRRAVHETFAALATTWLDEPALRVVDPELRSFTNVNTPEDLRRARGGDRA